MNHKYQKDFTLLILMIFIRSNRIPHSPRLPIFDGSTAPPPGTYDIASTMVAFFSKPN